MYRRARSSVLTLAAVALIGCSVAASDATAAPVRAAWDPAPSLEEILRAIGVLTHSGSTVAAHDAMTTVVDGLRQRQSLDQVRQSLRDLLESDDLYRQALGGAFCDGMRQVADGARPTYSNWRQFLYDWVESYAERYTGGFSIGRVRKTVDGVTNTWNLAKVNPAAARVYWNECVRF